MEKFITATGKTIDLAIEAGLTQLSMDRDSVSVEILETPKSGFFGIGASPAKVKLTYEAPDEPAAPAPALSSASRSKPKKPVSEKPAEAANAPKVIAPAAAPMQRPAEQRANAKPTAEKPERQEKPRQPRENKPRQEKNRQPKPQQPKKETAPAEPKVYTPAEPGSTEERIEQFIKGLLEHMGSDAVPHAMKTADESYSVDLAAARRSTRFSIWRTTRSTAARTSVCASTSTRRTTASSARNRSSGLHRRSPARSPSTAGTSLSSR